MQAKAIDRLPENLRLIIQLTDYRTALALAAEFGGSDYKFPRFNTITESHELAEFIGFNNLKKLCQFWNGENIYIPKADRYLSYIRDERIKQELRELGCKRNLNRELAKKYKVTDRWVRELKRRINQPAAIKQDNQLGLFEA